MLYIGSHVSYTKEFGLLTSVKESINYKANAFMFYTGSPQNVKRFEINNDLTKEAKKLMNENNILTDNVFVHAPYIINLANNTDPNKYDFYINFLKSEIKRVKQLGFKNLIVHPGSSVKLTKKEALDNIINAINIVLYKENDINILVEYMSGKGTELCSNIDELAYIINNVENKDHVFVCLDTCHMSDSGIDLDKYDEFLDVFDKKIGISKIKCIHLNDSLNIIASHKDRHANVGYGCIGFNTLISVVYNKRTFDIPKILETPIIKEGKLTGMPPYKYEIENIRNKEFIDFIK